MFGIIVSIVALLGLLVIFALLVRHFLIEDRNLSEVEFEDEEIPDQEEMEDEEDEDEDDYEDDDDEDDEDDYPEDRDIVILERSEKEPSSFTTDAARYRNADTVTNMMRMDHIGILNFRRELDRNANPHHYAPVKEYREFWRAEASAYKIAVDIDRAQWRKKNGLAA